MKDMVKEILSANEKAKKSKKKAEIKRFKFVGKMKARLDEKKSDYIDKARMNIKIIEKLERSKAEVEISKIKDEYEKTLHKIDEIYLKNKQEWCAQIFNSIVEKKR